MVGTPAFGSRGFEKKSLESSLYILLQSSQETAMIVSRIIPQYYLNYANLKLDIVRCIKYIWRPERLDTWFYSSILALHYLLNSHASQNIIFSFISYLIDFKTPSIVRDNFYLSIGFWKKKYVYYNRNCQYSKTKLTFITAFGNILCC